MSEAEFDEQGESTGVAESAWMEAARRIALESLKEDHRALELDAKYAFGPAQFVPKESETSS